MIIRDNYDDVTADPTTWKLTFSGTWMQRPDDDQLREGRKPHPVNRQQTARIQIDMYEFDEPLKYLVSATCLQGNKLAFYKIYEDIQRSVVDIAASTD